VVSSKGAQEREIAAPVRCRATSLYIRESSNKIVGKRGRCWVATNLVVGFVRANFVILVGFEPTPSRRLRDDFGEFEVYEYQSDIPKLSRARFSFQFVNSRELVLSSISCSISWPS
jgi:hypothetical protein